jgi:hypothetical protein
MIKKIILEFVGGCIFSIIVGYGFVGIYMALFEIRGETFSRGGFLIMLLLGIPIGILIGISLADRLLSKHWRVNIFGLVTGFILGLFGTVLGIYLLDVIGNVAFFLTPLIAVFLSLFGYNFKVLFKCNI